MEEKPANSERIRTESEFPRGVVDVIRRCAPSFAAVELLVFLETHPDCGWSAEELIASFQPRGFTPANVSAILSRFQRCSLLQVEADGKVRYAPSDPEIKDHIRQLAVAFTERPVSLIRVVYSIADEPIQSFADSFRLKSD